MPYVLETTSACAGEASALAAASARKWTMNSNLDYYHNTLSKAESPAFVQLSYKREETKEVVGVFRLDLPLLLAARHIRTEPADAADSENVRVRFVRRTNGSFYIQANDDAPALKIAAA
ncbi:MAG: hypothetical protein Q7J29_02045 [Stagnimonas sp.]|nr:hypothetical protein [Stagnimonas sp.]